MPVSNPGKKRRGEITAFQGQSLIFFVLSRFDIAINLVTKHLSTIPLPIRGTAQSLLLPEFKVDASDRYPSVGDFGLPPPSAFQIMMPMTSTLTFPKHFPTFAKILRSLDDISGVYRVSVATNPGEIQATDIRLKVCRSNVTCVTYKLHK